MRALSCLALAALAPSGCALFSPLPDARDATDRAHDLDLSCKTTSEGGAGYVLARSAIESVEPLLSTVPSGNSYATRLIGSKIAIKPLPGLTQELLSRELQCHEARVLLGVAKPLQGDPYAIAGAWLDIAADSVGNGFLVRVQSFEFETAKEMLARATRYAGGQ